MRPAMLVVVAATFAASAGCRKDAASTGGDGGGRPGSSGGTSASAGHEPLPVAAATISGLRVDGAEPRFSWTAVDGAAAYGVGVAVAGRSVWNWTGAGTSVVFGAPSVTIPPSPALRGVALPPRSRWAEAGVEYRWFVEAYDARGRPVATSDLRSFTCTEPCGTLAPPEPAAAPVQTALPGTVVASAATVPSVVAELPPEIAARAGGALDAVLGSIAEIPERPGFPAWSRLAAFTPDRLGGLPATGPATGTTAEAMGMAVTSATRVYEAGGRRAEVSVVGGDAAKMASLEFDVRLPDRIGPDEVRRRVEIGGRPVMLEWAREGGTAEARTLLAGLYYVTVKVTPADDTDPARDLLTALDLDGLSALR